MAESDHEQMADRLEDESEKLARHAEELGGDIEHARDEWDRKRADPGVPGAPAPEERVEQDPTEQQTPPG